MKISCGTPFPLGATVTGTGVNFSIFSRFADQVTLLLFDHLNPGRMTHQIELVPINHRTGHLWHIEVESLGIGQLYGFSLDGIYKPESGHRFNKNKLILDPYARCIVGNYCFDRSELYGYDKGSPIGDLSFSHQHDFSIAPRCKVVGNLDTFCPDDRHIHIPLENMIIYEVNLKGFTSNPNSKVQFQGTYQGFSEKIPYLTDLGITTVEFMPIQEFNPLEIIRINPVTRDHLKQYWGYSTINYFSPAHHLAAETVNHVQEFRCLVKACHDAGLEVILDVVYNHTGEGGLDGPTLCYRGIDNSVYYMLEDSKRYYKNYSGCGNTFNCNMPVVKQLILDSLRYWYCEMKVDGFRFDLAPILGRNTKGEWVGENSILNDILNDPLLADCKLIAEGWDAGGLYKLGNFPVGWQEWNGKFRDSIRRFWRGDDHTIHDFLNAWLGSPEIYGNFKTPDHSINYITCHDGFTLRDLVSYTSKHNFENSENNQDGLNENFSFNWGTEGETADPEINKIRLRQVKNFLSVLMLAHGVPMLYSGDEIFRTQKGNNNAYCQDVLWNWFDWDYTRLYSDLLDFTQKLIGFRKKHSILRQNRYFKDVSPSLNDLHDIWKQDISFHGVEINRPDYNPYSHTIAFLMNGFRIGVTDSPADTPSLYFVVNAYHEPLMFAIPQPPSFEYAWFLQIDTGADYPNDFLVRPERVTESGITLISHSMVVLVLQKS